MHTFLFLLGCVAFVAGVHGAIGLGRRWIEARRARELAGVAPELELSFVGDQQPELLAGLDVALFAGAVENRQHHLLRGPGETPRVVLYDHVRMVDLGRATAAEPQTVLAMRWPGAAIPPFAMHPRVATPACAAGYVAVEPRELAQPFLARYVLRAASDGDPERIAGVFEPRLCWQLQERADPIGVEGAGEWLVAYRARQRVPGHALAAWLAEALETLHAVRARLTVALLLVALATPAAAQRQIKGRDLEAVWTGELVTR